MFHVLHRDTHLLPERDVGFARGSFHGACMKADRGNEKLLLLLLLVVTAAGENGQKIFNYTLQGETQPNKRILAYEVTRYGGSEGCKQ